MSQYDSAPGREDGLHPLHQRDTLVNWSNSLIDVTRWEEGPSVSLLPCQCTPADLSTLCEPYQRPSVLGRSALITTSEMVVGILLEGLPLLLFALGAGATHGGEPDCRGIGAQTSVDLDQVMGMWYAVEVVHHYEGPKSRLVLGRTVVDTCPVLHLQRVDDHRIRLLWAEDAGVIEYNFSISNIHNPGFWITIGAQNGSLLSTHKRYRQFAGTVEVTKAVGTHMVLTFCTPRQELYSVVMSREKWLHAGELHGVNRMLENRQLPRLAVKEACKNSSGQIVVSLPLFAMVLAYFYGTEIA